MPENWLNKQENILKSIDQTINNINIRFNNNKIESKDIESWLYNFYHIFENIQKQLGWEEKLKGKKKLFLNFLIF